MHAFQMQTMTEVKLWLRRRQAVVGTLLMPVLFMLFFGALYGSETIPNTGGLKYTNFIVPGYAVFAAMAVSLGTLSSNLASERQFDILKRLGGTPLPRSFLLGSKILAGALLGAGVIIVLVVLGIIFYGAEIKGNILAAIFILVLGTLSFAAMGIAMGGIVKPDSAVAIGNLVYLGMSFLGGVFVPLSSFPPFLRDIANVLPSEHMVHALQSIWTLGLSINHVWGDILVILAWGVGATIIGVRFFRWE